MLGLVFSTRELHGQPKERHSVACSLKLSPSLSLTRISRPSVRSRSKLRHNSLVPPQTAAQPAGGASFGPAVQFERQAEGIDHCYLTP